jgi:hypothetical protein
MDSGGAPEGIRRGHLCDQGADFGADAWAALSGPAGEFGPMLSETAPPPPQNGVRGNDHEGVPPPGPGPG